MFSATALSAEVRALTDRFLETPIGGTITFAAMSDAIGADIHARAYLIQRAIRIASRESGAIFGSVRRVGYVRHAPEEAFKIGHSARSRIRRTAGTAAKRISAAVQMANDMPDDAKSKAYAEVSSLELLRHLASAHGAVTAVKETNRPLPVAETMRLMMKKIGAEVTT